MPKQLLKQCVLALCLLTFSAELVFAREESAEPDYFELSIEELMKVSFKVSVSEASNQEESILKTPAIVSRFDESDLRSMGLNNLKDFLSFVPGLVWDEGAFGNGQLMIRGVSENFGQKVLFMLDDVPYWQSAHSAIPLLGIPLSSIAHIEVIRGPGLAQQGSGATTGVVKVVTKKHANNAANLRIGSNSLVNANFYVHHEFLPGHNINLSAELQDEKGFLASYENIDLGVSSTNKRAQDFKSILAQYSWSNQTQTMNVSAHKYQSSVNGVNSPERLLPNVLTYWGELLAFSYDHRFSDALTLDLYSDYNKHYLAFDIENFPFDGSQGRIEFEDEGNNNYRWRSGAKAVWTLNTNVNWIFGYDYEHRETGDYEISSLNLNQSFGNAIAAESADEEAIYTQVDTTLGKWRFLAGLRYVENSRAGEEYLPQLSLVYSLDESQSIKALYSVGFNSPNFFQTDIDIPNPSPATVGNPDLLAEKVESFDVSYSYFKNNHQLVANVYYLKGKDFIQRVALDNQVTFQNSLEFDRWGYELDYQMSTDKLRYFMNLSYQHQGAQINVDDIQAKFVPKYAFSAGGHYTFTDRHHVGMSWRFVDNRYSENLTSIDSYHWINLQYRYTLKDWEMMFSIVNALDDDITNPDVESNTTQRILHSDGLGYMLDVIWNF